MKTKNDLEKYFRSIFNFPIASENEIKIWPYKTELRVSYKFLVGKKLFYKNNFVGNVKDYIIRKNVNGRGKTNRLYLITDSGQYSPTNCFFEYFNPFYNKVQLVALHPTRNGRNFWELGYLIEEKEYKKFYYTTTEYRTKYEKSLNQNFNTSGLTAPVQIKEVKDKISKSIFEKYNVPWFLNRGFHYSAITETMNFCYGIDNFFKDEVWQMENAKKTNKNFKTTSKLEREIFEELENLGLENSYYKNSKLGEKILVINTHKFFRLDFYNEKNNLVIEVMGDYWHCNPNAYSHNYYHKNKGKYASELWKDDFDRKNKIINILNCSFFEIWESDWKYNKENVLSFIKNQIL